MKFIRKYRKAFVLLTLISTVFPIVSPIFVLALTAGPSQPEVQSFQPATASNMVDLFTGDFSYNIPLFELPGPNGGYPFNLSYQSGITMDQEGSWVGLGFNVGTGCVTRQMRGIPDEFKGDVVTTKVSLKPSVTVGVGAGVGLEVFGAAAELGKIGLSVRHNNYKGRGYSIDGSVGFGAATSSGTTAGVGVNFSLDSEEGVSVSPSLSLGSKAGTFGLGVGYNSKSGLSNVSTSWDRELSRRTVDVKNKEGKVISKKTTWVNHISTSATLSFAHPGFTPRISMPMRGTNITGTFKAGAGFYGAFPSFYITGFYNEQRLKNNSKLVGTPAYGYLYAQNAGGGDLMDVNREKDGVVSKVSPNLPVPSATYDIYAITGQGLSLMYRPMRNDIGLLHDPEAEGKSTSAGLGVDVGPPSHPGFNASLSHSKSKSHAWTSDNDLTGVYQYKGPALNSLIEPYYYKVHGEASPESTQTSADLGDDGAVRIALDNHKATARLEKRGWSRPAANNANSTRQQRSQLVQSLTNAQVEHDGVTFMNALKINYQRPDGATEGYIRHGEPHHVAAVVVTTQEGLRYNYALPAYNFQQEEVMFSAYNSNPAQQVSRVNTQASSGEDPKYKHSQVNTDEFLKRTKIPEYAYAHMLTSILGPDYVDVTGDGVSEDDLGYWVNFTYRCVADRSDPYKWRDPFSKAHYQQGWMTDNRDDRGSFVYGTKEIWYLAKAETKSHIATFNISPRQDGKGVANKLQDTDLTGKAMYQLDAIHLFTRAGGKQAPIKTVRFTYDYQLCQGVFNGTGGQGKLTLKKVHFEYGNSSRGALNPYEFTYHQSNPSYDILAFDRWGTFKPYPSGQAYANNYLPYTDQNPSNKSNIDTQAASWSLTGIRSPSGAKITIDYETDDYAYVQHKPAMQMMQLVDPYADSENAEVNPIFTIDYDNPKIRFKLEKPIADEANVDQTAEVKKYIDVKRPQLFFKALINLLSPDQDQFEYLNAYADINLDAEMGLEKGSSGQYEYGFFHLKKERKAHPLSLRAWQHVRTNQPDLPHRNKYKFEADSDNKARIRRIMALATPDVVNEVRKMFEGVYRFSRNNEWGKELWASRSVVRLKSPDGVKYGGGLRVKQVTLQDGWSQNAEGVYGQRYLYTMDENGNTISSGVAAYEPFTGGEENPLRYAKEYVESIPLATDNNLFFEYPVNETYYPGAQVGYRKVTVMSLASAHRAGVPLDNVLATDGQPLFPDKSIAIGTTGKSEHEFYTAKDFPYLASETDNFKKTTQYSFGIPFLGHISRYHLTASQGYSIVTNDMHGKPKKISQFRQGEDGAFEKEPMSYVAYKYLSKPRLYENEQVFELQNIVQLNGDGTLSLGNTSGSNVTYGQETDFMVDMNEYEDSSLSGGIRGNLDIIFATFIPIPIPTAWPDIGQEYRRLRVAVTNKVIFKAGILIETEVYDGGSRVVTRPLKWDRLTGAATLEMVNNNFDKPVFKYTIAGYSQYQGMGASFTNAGLTFAVNDIRTSQNSEYTFTTEGSAGNYLFPGDELMLYAKDTGFPIAQAIYTGDDRGHKLYCAVSIPSAPYTAMVLRSGLRNQLSVAAGTITALEDPTVPGVQKTYSKTVRVPKSN